MPLKETDIQFGGTGLDYYLEHSTGSERVPLPKDLTGFKRIAENTLVSLAERDLWQISDDGQFIERLFDTEGIPLKMPEPAQKASSKVAAVEDVGERANEIILLLENAPGKSISTSAEVAREIARADQGINFRYLKNASNEYRILRKGANDEAYPTPPVQTIEDLKAPLQDQIEQALSDPELTVVDDIRSLTSDLKTDQALKKLEDATKDLQESKSTETEKLMKNIGDMAKKMKMQSSIKTAEIPIQFTEEQITKILDFLDYGRGSDDPEIQKLVNIFEEALRNPDDDSQANPDPIGNSNMAKKKNAIELEVMGPNQTKVYIGHYTVFFSYNTPVAYYDQTNHQYFVTNKKWSNTTTKHINNFLRGEKATPVDQSFLDNFPSGPNKE